MNEHRAGHILARCRDRYDAALRFRSENHHAWEERRAAFQGQTWYRRGGPGSGPEDEEGNEIRLELNEIRRNTRVATNTLVKQAPSPSVPPATNEATDRAAAEYSERILRHVLKHRRAELAVLEGQLEGNIVGAAYVKIWWDPLAGAAVEHPIYALDRPPYPEGDPFGDEGDDDERDADAGAGMASSVYDRRPTDMLPPLSAATDNVVALRPTMEGTEEDEGRPGQAESEAGSTEVPKYDVFGEPVVEREYEGDVTYSFCAPDEVLIEPHQKHFDDCEWVIHHRTFPLERLLEMYPNDVLGRPTRDYLARGAVKQGTETSHRYPQAATRHIDAAREFEPELCEYWEKPSRRYAHGRLIVWCGDALLYYGPIPYRPARVPFICLLGENKVPGRPFADGMVHDQIPVQKVRNYMISKAAEIERIGVNLRLLIPDTADVDEDSFTDTHGNIRYRYPHKPEFMPYPDVPMSLPTIAAQLGATQEKIVGVSDVSAGGGPADASGRAIAFLKEADAGFRYFDQAWFHEAYRTLCVQTLMLVHQFYEDGRMLRIAGKNSRWEVLAFERAQFSTNYDVEIEPYSGVPQSRAQRYSEAMELYKAGAFGAPGTPEAASRLLKIVEWDHAGRLAYEGNEIDRANAREENMLFLGQMPQSVQVQPHDDHAIHIEEHLQCMKTREFRDLPHQIQYEAEMHLFQHEQAQQGQNVAVAGQMQQLGAPAGAGAPSGPPGPEDVANPTALEGGQPTNAPGAPRLAAEHGAALHELDADVEHVRQAAQQAVGTR